MIITEVYVRTLVRQELNNILFEETKNDFTENNKFILSDLEQDPETKQKPTDNEKYIFVLDDPKRGYNIDMSKVTDEYKIIHNDYQFRMFDYIKLLENAEEIHMMQTGFLDLVNSYKMDKPKIYRHNYVRNYPETIHSKGLNEVIGVD